MKISPALLAGDGVMPLGMKLALSAPKAPDAVGSSSHISGCTHLGSLSFATKLETWHGTFRARDFVSSFPMSIKLMTEIIDGSTLNALA